MAQVHHVAVGSQAHVVREIPSRVVRVIVQHDVVVVPVPIAAIIVIIRRNREEETANFETVAAAAVHPPNMMGADGIGKVPMLPGVVEVIVLIAAIVADPPIVFRVYMRRFGMAFLVTEAAAHVVLRRSSFMALRRTILAVGSAIRSAALGGTAMSGAVRGNVSIADSVLTAASLFASPLFASPLLGRGGMFLSTSLLPTAFLVFAVHK